MKVTFLKQHNEHLSGEEAEIPDGTAQYLITMGVAKEATEKKEVADTKEKKEVKPTSKKHIDKP